MNIHFDNIFPYSNFHNIFSEKDIYIDHSNLNMDKNIEIEEANLKNNFEPFDNLFNNRNSRISSYDENEFQKISLKPYSQIPEAQNILNNIPKDFNMKENLNKKRIIKKLENNMEMNKSNKQKDKKVLFNSYKLNPLTEKEKLELKQKNKISARKSRLKKKQYISKLEQEHSLLINQLEEIRQNLGLNKNIIPLKETEGNLNFTNKIDCDLCSKIENLNAEEKFILINENNNKKNSEHLLNLFSENQKKILERLFINQILIMMPIKIKIFQYKYLKLLTFNREENLKDIKTKIDKNIETIQELYDINNLTNEENGIKNDMNLKKLNKNGSMAQQIYNYYYNLKRFINKFEEIFYSISSFND